MGNYLLFGEGTETQWDSNDQVCTFMTVYMSHALTTRGSETPPSSDGKLYERTSLMLNRRIIAAKAWE